MRSISAPTPGRWYFTVTCRTCNSPVRFFVDDTNGQQPIKAKKDLNVQCLHCRTNHIYNTAEMFSTQDPRKLSDHKSG